MLLLLVGQPVWLAASASKAIFYLGLAVFCSSVAGFAALLITTPPDAIRLPVDRSWRVIVAGTLWLHGAAALILGRHADVAAWLWVAIVVLGTLAVLSALRRSDKSLWWATLFAWNPLALIGPVAVFAPQL